MMASVCLTIFVLAQLFPVFSYSACFVCGLIILIAALTVNLKYGFCVYLVVSLLSSFMVCGKSNIFLFIVLFGYYPLILLKLKEVKSFFLTVFLKVALFAVISFFVNFAFYYVSMLRKTSFFKYFFVGVGVVFLSFVVYEYFLNSFLKYQYLNFKNKYLKYFNF